MRVRITLVAWLMVGVLEGLSHCLIALEPDKPDEADLKRVVQMPDGIHQVSFPSSATIDRADLYFWCPAGAENRVRAVMVISPGRNGNGLPFLNRAEWREFASINNLALCALSFSSKKKFVDQSYSNANSGSGKMVTQGIDAYLSSIGKDPLPLLMYGFSAGARFTASYVEENSDRVVAWCGQAVGKWERAKATEAKPPGIVACGEWDAGCYHASLIYFQQGRELGKPWTWICLKETGHQRSSELDEYVRAFFAGALNQEDFERRNGSYFDIDTRKSLTRTEQEDWPIFASWVAEGMADSWLLLHQP
ncbi:MAG: hypothetical protein CMO55_28640 [Verrucomicrobiales bacterium]|nr:hypothetical protein [Verrucomicrobiales bacterium]